MLKQGEGVVGSAPDAIDEGRGRRRGTGALQTGFNDAIDRRRFMTLAGCAAALMAAGEWMGSRLDAAVRTEPDIVLSDAASLVSGEARPIVARDGRATLVVKLDDDIVAYDRRCPHLGCPVLWSPERGRFECPCHHAAFDARTGRVLFGPPRHGLTRANVRMA